MDSDLASFLRGLDDPELAALSPALAERLLTSIFRDSGFSITLRNGAGRARSITDIGVEGRSADGAFDDTRLRYFGRDGAELSRLQHPVHRVRTSGTSEQSWVMGLLGRSERMRWYVGSTVALRREPEGWSTLTATAEVSELFRRQHEAELRAEACEALLGLASSLLVSGASDPEAVAAAAGPFAARIFPQSMVVLSFIEGADVRLWPVQMRPGVDPPPLRMSLQQLRPIWSEGMYVSQSVADTDIFGSIVVGALDHPFRSIAMAPVAVAGERRGSFTAVSPLRHAFSDLQIAAIEQAGALLGQALAEPVDRAA